MIRQLQKLMQQMPVVSVKIRNSLLHLKHFKLISNPTHSPTPINKTISSSWAQGCPSTSRGVAVCLRLHGFRFFSLFQSNFLFIFLICRNTHLIREHLLMVRVGFRSGLDTTTGDVELSVATHMTFPSHYGTVTKIHAGSWGTVPSTNLPLCGWTAAALKVTIHTIILPLNVPPQPEHQHYTTESPLINTNFSIPKHWMVN